MNIFDLFEAASFCELIASTQGEIIIIIIIIIMMSESQEASENDMCGGAIFSVPFI